MKRLFKISIVLCIFLTLLCLASCKKLCLHFDIEATVTPPTCTEGGYTNNQCTKCDYSYITDEKDPTGHDITSTITPSTCDVQGYTTNECHCGYSFVSDYVTPLGHLFSDTVTDPDCDEPGYTVHTCDSCGYSYSDSYLTSLGHTLDKKTTDPTCTEQGYTVYSCTCGFKYTSDFTQALGHALDKKKTEPTCTTEGYTVYSCSCGYSYTSDYVEPTGHTYTEVITNATCSEAGYTTRTCACGHVFKADIVSAFGHDFTRTTVNPTVSDMGYTDFTCRRCDFSYRGNYRFYSEILPDGAYAKNSTVLARGIDISKYNHPTTPAGEFLSLDWSAIKSEGIDYVILKAASTRSGKEATFDLDYSEAKEAGLDVGVYFYTYSKTVSQIKADAQMLLNILDGKSFEYPIYLDLEDETLLDIEPSVLTEMCVTFISILQENGYYAGLYVNHEWLYNILQTEKMLDMFEIWYARYPQNVTEYVWDTATYGEHLGMWQYTDKGRLDAIPDIDVDFNYAYKDYPEIIKELSQK